jgi:hypothetical protein
MAYSDFKLNKLLKSFNLTQNRNPLFEQIKPLEIDPWLKETLNKGMQLIIGSEKARSELIVMPILLASRERNQNCFAIYSGETLDVNADKGLNGECDFILTYSQPLPAIQSPIFTVVEAKKSAIESYLGQCAAQMLGARLFNQDEKNDCEIIYGCVTTGEAWQFMKLENEVLYIDSRRYYINNVDEILGVLQVIIDFYK